MAELAPAQTGSGVLTLQIGGNPLPPTPLVSASESWHYHLGTNAPQANWRTLADGVLDTSWATGPAGFGYEDGDDATLLLSMSNRCTTLYIRRSFEITEAADPVRHLQLVMDYDDGFIAWLDGTEIARSSNAPGAVGTEPAYTAVSSPPNHEALGYRGLAAEVYDAGLVGSRLQPGTHVLAILGLNGALTSSDFSLIPNLRLSGGGGAMNGSFFSLITTNVVQLSGSNTVPGSVCVTVNGDAANFDPAQGTWSRSHTLDSGLNRLFIAALGADGSILASTNKDVIVEMAMTEVGGLITNSASWTAAQGIVRVTNTVVVADGATLSIGEGVVVLLSPNAGLQAKAHGTMEAMGTAERPVCFLPANGTTPWQSLWADGANAVLTLRQAEVVAGQVVAATNSIVTLEDTVVRDYHVTGRNMVQGLGGAQFTLRRCHLLRYEQSRFAQTPMLIEDCLIEEIGSDSTDFADQADSVVRRTTYRYGHGGNTDGIDLGDSPGFLAEQCLIHDFPDKAVSVAQNSHNVAVRNCLIYNVGIGIATYASSNCLYTQNTIADSTSGLSLYLRAGFTGPGHALATNNIIWGNVTNIHLSDNATLEIGSSDVEGATVFPGIGNINADPLFLAPAEADYRLAAGSPCLGTGLGGADMGAVAPVGGIPPAPALLAAGGLSTNQVRLWWQEDADNETGFEIERSASGSTWASLATVPANSTDFTDGPLPMDAFYYYRVRALNTSGRSRFSNMAAAGPLGLPATVVGGVLASNTVWSPTWGTILVASSVIVPTNLSLTIQAGTVIRLTNNVSIVARTGGVVRIEGTWDQRVILERWNGTNNWSELRAEGTNSLLEVRFADISGGQTTVFYGAQGLLEDTAFHDFVQQGAGTTFNQPLVLMHYAAPGIVRRCTFYNYYETLWRNGIFLIEDCIFQDMVGDALDFDAAQPGTILRRCTFRHGWRGNVDAVDVGPAEMGGAQDVVIESCHMHDFPHDKGVSIGEGSHGTVVRNCLIYQVSRGVQVKDTCTAILYNNTIVDSEIGFHGYEKYPNYPGGGLITNAYNNILWNNTNAFVLEPDSVFVLHHSDLSNTNWPGEGNLDTDPLFVDPATHNYRLQAGSPCLGTGLDGANMGVTYPVGSFIDTPTGLAAVGSSNTILLTWFDNSPSEAVFGVERSIDGSAFTNIAYAPFNSTNYADADLLAGFAYRYRVRGLNINTNSEYSAEAVAMVGQPPQITGQPQGLVVTPGSDVSFEVTAIGSEPLAFAWRFNGSPLASQSGSVLSLSQVQVSESGDYSAVVTDAAGLSATSAVARLTVTLPPQLVLDLGGTGSLSFQAAAPPGIHFLIEASTNLANWLPVQTNSTGAGWIEYIDPDSANFPRRYYRAWLLP